MHQITRRLVLVAVAAILAASTVGAPVAFAARPGRPVYGDGWSNRTTSSSGVSPAPAPLSSNATDVAARHGITEGELRRRLSKDKHLKVRKGRLMYQEATLSELGIVGADTPPTPRVAAADTPAPADAFTLHSVPGAKRVIYLDFDGHLLSGTAWNASYNAGADIVCPAWDIEGGPSVFTDTERARIVEVWQRVAEDYSPFDVDVTTQYPGEAAITRGSPADEYYGMRVLISPISSYVGSYGGVAYIGVFDSVGDYYKPALVFPEQLSNGAKYIAEAATHENGHTLGLYHDGTTTGSAYYGGHGTGETGWAPIMGNGYSRNVTQWSRGEYPDANNTEDDLAVMQTNGISYRADDKGNGTADASTIPAGSSFVVGGRIERNTDVDVMRFTSGAGTLTVTASPAVKGPNVDILTELRNSSGSLVAASNPADLLSASTSVYLSAGTYYLYVRGTGKGDLATGYSAYGCLGEYTIAGSLDEPPVEPPTQLPPVAVANATPATGQAPLSVQLSSALSSDPDGQIVGWSWTFGDGTSSTAANPVHTFTAAGTYSVGLTVTDNTGLTGSASVTVTATTPNTAPVASMSAAPSAGAAPLVVQFSGAGSSDLDGTIVSYAWDFGDGTTASGSNASHTYAAGRYTARLTVTDNLGATGTATKVITVQPNAALVMRVAALQLTLTTSGSLSSGKAVVRVTTPEGVAVSGVSVTGAWSGMVSGTSMGTTDASGNAVLLSKRFKKTSGTLVFSVTKLSKAGYSYDPGKNIVTTATLVGGTTR